MLDPISGLILDFDGTICATRDAICESIISTFQSSELQIPSRCRVIAEIRRGQGLRDVINALSSIELDENDISELCALYRRNYLGLAEDREVPFEGIRELCESAKERELPILIISNKGSVAITRALKRFDLDRFVDRVYGDDPGTPCKPDPMVFWKEVIPAWSAHDPSAFLMVGDTACDILFSRNCRIRSCWARYGYGDERECRALQPFIIIDTPSALIEHLPAS